MNTSLMSTTSFNPADPALYRVSDLQMQLAKVSESTSDPTQFCDALVAIAQCAAIAELVLNNTSWEHTRDQENWEALRKSAQTVLERYKSRFAPMMPAQRNLVALPLTETTKAKIVARHSAGSGKRLNLSDEKMDEIGIAYMNGYTIRQVADQFGISTKSVQNVLAKRNVPTRARGTRGMYD